MADVVYLRRDDADARRALDATIELLERLRAAPLEVEIDHTAQERISSQFQQLMMLLAGEPSLAAVCSSALVSDEPSVRSVQRRIHDELRRRVRAAMRWGAWPEVIETLEFGLIGSLVHASCAGVTSGQTADRLASVVFAVLSDDDQAP